MGQREEAGSAQGRTVVLGVCGANTGDVARNIDSRGPLNLGFGIRRVQWGHCLGGKGSSLQAHVESAVPGLKGKLMILYGC